MKIRGPYRAPRRPTRVENSARAIFQIDDYADKPIRLVTVSRNIK